MKRTAVMFVVAVLAWMPPAAGEAPEATAWWWAASHDALGLPAETPTPVEEGGLYVAGHPNGEMGVAALRLPVADNQAVGELVLAIDTDEQTGVPKAQGDVALQACPAARVWAPEEGGPLDRAPACDPSGLAFGSVVEGKVRFPVGGLVRSGLLSVVIRPQPGRVFQVAFERPGDDAIQVTTYDTGSDDDDGGGAPGGFEGFEDFDPGAAFDVPTVSDVPSFVEDLGGAAPVDAAGPAAPPPGGDSGVAPETALPRAPRPASSDRTSQVVSAVVVLGLILLYLGLLQAPGHRPRLLGPFSRDHAHAPAASVPSPSLVDLPRGIGRFARPRAGPAPKL